MKGNTAQKIKFFIKDFFSKNFWSQDGKILYTNANDRNKIKMRC